MYLYWGIIFHGDECVGCAAMDCLKLLFIVWRIL